MNSSEPGQPWYRLTFGQAYLDLYGDYLENRLPMEVEGMLRLCLLPAGARLLDLACGHGRHAVSLAGMGFEVTGLDQSRLFLNRARQRAQAQAVTVRWLRADMRKIPFSGEFDLVMSLYNAFGLFEDDLENAQVLDGIFQALAPGGRLFLDLLDCGKALRDLGEGQATMAFGQLSERTEYDPHGRRLLIHQKLRGPRGRARQLFHSLRLYDPEELRGLLRARGFSTLAQWGGFDGSPPGSGDRLITLAQRP